MSQKVLFACLGLSAIVAWLTPWKSWLSASAEEQPAATERPVTTEAGEDRFPAKVRLRYAKTFTVEYHRNYKVVTVSPSTESKSATFRYILVQRGTPRPTDYSNAQFIEVPVRSIVTMSTSQLGFIDKLGLAEKVVGHDELDCVNTPSILKRIKEGKVVEVGHDQDVNLEVVLSLAPDLVMAYWTGIPQHEIHPKLMQAGIPVAINVEFMEPLPLGWAEWLKYVAVFFNLESEGERLFDEMAGEYDRLSALARKAGTRPTVLTGGNHRGTWYMGSGNSYFANMVRDAGAEYLWSDDRSTGVRTLDFETVFERAANADFWVNTGVYKSLDEVRSADPRHAALAAFKNRRIYNNNARLNEHGSSDYWESAAANPDRVLADLIRIFHPDLLPDHQLTWYHKLEFSDDPQKH